MLTFPRLILCYFLLELIEARKKMRARSCVTDRAGWGAGVGVTSSDPETSDVEKSLTKDSFWEATMSCLHPPAAEDSCEYPSTFKGLNSPLRDGGSTRFSVAVWEALLSVQVRPCRDTRVMVFLLPRPSSGCWIKSIQIENS